MQNVGNVQPHQGHLQLVSVIMKSKLKSTWHVLKYLICIWLDHKLYIRSSPGGIYNIISCVRCPFHYAQINSDKLLESLPIPPNTSIKSVYIQ